MGREDGKPAFDPFPRRKNKFNIEGPIGTLSDIKLIRTDTTLDHSQKAEKQRKKRKILGRNSVSNMSLFYSAPFRALLVGPLLSLSFPFFAFSLSFIPLLSSFSPGSSLRSEGIGLWRVVGREDFGKMEEVDTESIQISCLDLPPPPLLHSWQMVPSSSSSSSSPSPSSSSSCCWCYVSFGICVAGYGRLFFLFFSFFLLRE